MKPGASNYRHPSPHHTHPESRGTDTPTPGDQTSEVRVSQGWAPCRGSRGGSFPPLAASRGSRRLSLGRWPPLRLHVASPLRPCLSSSLSYKDPVLGFRATPIQEDLISDPSLHHTCRDLISREGPVLKFRLAANTLGWGETIPLMTASSKQHVIHILFGRMCILHLR